MFICGKQEIALQRRNVYAGELKIQQMADWIKKQQPAHAIKKQNNNQRSLPPPTADELRCCAAHDGFKKTVHGFPLLIQKYLKMTHLQQ